MRYFYILRENSPNHNFITFFVIFIWKNNRRIDLFLHFSKLLWNTYRKEFLTIAIIPYYNLYKSVSRNFSPTYIFLILFSSRKWRPPTSWSWWRRPGRWHGRFWRSWSSWRSRHFVPSNTTFTSGKDVQSNKQNCQMKWILFSRIFF